MNYYVQGVVSVRLTPRAFALRQRGKRNWEKWNLPGASEESRGVTPVNLRGTDYLRAR